MEELHHFGDHGEAFFVEHIFAPALELLAQHEVGLLVGEGGDLFHLASLGTAARFHPHTARGFGAEDGTAVGGGIGGNQPNSGEVADHFAGISHGNAR